jgi:hypothetical protein
MGSQRTRYTRSLNRTHRLLVTQKVQVLKKSCSIKNQEDLKLNNKRQAVDANMENIKVLELPNKDFKTVTIKCP